MVEVGDIEDIQEMQGNQIFANNQIRIRFSMIDTKSVLYILIYYVYKTSYYLT